MPPTKRKSTYTRSDSFIASSASPPASNKRAKNQSKSTTKPSSSSSNIPSQQEDEEGNAFWQLSTARRVTISDFKGKKMVSIREYYEKDGNWLPGKKGITMPMDQYNEFLKVLPQIENALSKDGEEIERPNYAAKGGEVKSEDLDVDVEGDGDEMSDGDEEQGNTKRNGNGKVRKKSNIEATSDEDED